MSGYTETPNPAVNSEWVSYTGFAWTDAFQYSVHSDLNITARDLRIMQEVLLSLKYGLSGPPLPPNYFRDVQFAGINPGFLDGRPQTRPGVLYKDLSDDVKDFLMKENRIINPFGRVDQRRAGATTTVAAAANAMVADRFKLINDTSAAVVTISGNDSTVPSENDFALNGQKYYKIPSSMKLAFTTADASLATTEQIILRHSIEGDNAADFVGDGYNYGLTVSFWLRSPKAGPHGVKIGNSGSDRCYVTCVNHKAANQWQFHTVYIKSKPPSGGTWNSSNGIGLNLDITFAAPATSGSNNAVDGQWVSASKFYTDGQVNCADVNTNVAYITAIKVAPGNIITPAAVQDRQLLIAACQRYAYAMSGNEMAYTAKSMGYKSAATVFEQWVPFPQPMRDAPTGTHNITGFNSGSGATGTSISIFDISAGAYRTGTYSSFTAVGSGTDLGYVNATITALSGTVGQLGWIGLSSSARIIYSAEL